MSAHRTRERRIARSAYLLPAGLLFLFAPGPGIVQATDQQPERMISREVHLTPDMLLVVEGDDGPVRVVGGSGGTASIEVGLMTRGTDPAARNRLLETADLITAQEGERVILRIVVPDGISAGLRAAAGEVPPAALESSWTITFPVQNLIEIRTGRGCTRLESTGPVRLESTVGDVVARDMRGDLTAGSVSGNILVEGCDGNTDVNTVSGDITLERVTGAVRATCISGNIQIRGPHSGHVRVSNTGGNITYEGAVQDGGTYSLGSHSGNILFVAEGAVGFSAQLSTYSGSISTPLDFALTGPRTTRRSLTGQLGGAEASVTLTAYSGDITIRRQHR